MFKFNKKKKIAKFLSIEQKVRISILAHTVYEHRALLSSLRKYKVKIFHINGFNFFKQGNLKDHHWELIKKSFYEFIIKIITVKNIKNYWILRNKGKVGNHEAKIATQIKSKLNKDIRPNIIMLHVFRDSPYAFIKGERIFCDFIDWFTKTLEIISRSEEQWQIRFHPVAKSWGEDQEIWIRETLKKVSYKKNNIFIDKLYFSNKEVFNSAKRVVTFSGTASMEAAANGIKPITIAETTLSYLNKDLTIKAKNLQHYEDLLLKNSNSTDFQINSDNLEGGLSLSDEEVTKTIILLAEQLKIVVEPGGAVAAAAVLNNKIDVRNKKIIVMISGGNIDLSLFNKL